MVKFGNNWDEILEGEFQKEYYKRLREFLKSEYSCRKIYPPMGDIFNALKYTDYQDVKVVILGQDPYHQEGQAHGLSFSVKKGIPKPPSLENIYKELQSDLGITMPKHGCLEKWAKEGVLLLNAVLTVQASNANSHKDKGWEIFTDEIIKILNKREKPMVFMLWGANAGKKKALITNKNHLILEAPHPSPLSAYRGFFGCGHFGKANRFLEENKIGAIDWQIDDKDKRIYISALSNQELAKYIKEKYGSEYKIYTVGKREGNANILETHPDMYMCRMGAGAEAEVLTVKDIAEIRGEYPENIGYNGVCVGKYFIHNKEYTSERLKNLVERKDLEIISVKQGYTKCNAVVVDEKSLITSDEGMYKSIKNAAAEIDVLLIEKGHVLLEGFDYGFLGGASGRIQNEIIFNGNLRAHPNFAEIERFISDRNLKVTYFEDYPLTDIGSIIAEN